MERGNSPYIICWFFGRLVHVAGSKKEKKKSGDFYPTTLLKSGFYYLGRGESYATPNIGGFHDLAPRRWVLGVFAMAPRPKYGPKTTWKTKNECERYNRPFRSVNLRTCTIYSQGEYGPIYMLMRSRSKSHDDGKKKKEKSLVCIVPYAIINTNAEKAFGNQREKWGPIIAAAVFVIAGDKGLWSMTQECAYRAAHSHQQRLAAYKLGSLSIIWRVQRPSFF